jgi:hypothetical protein
VSAPSHRREGTIPASHPWTTTTRHGRKNSPPPRALQTRWVAQPGPGPRGNAQFGRTIGPSHLSGLTGTESWVKTLGTPFISEGKGRPTSALAAILVDDQGRCSRVRFAAARSGDH